MQVEIKIDNSCKETKVIVVTDKITDEINTLVKKLAEDTTQFLVGFQGDIIVWSSTPPNSRKIQTSGSKGISAPEKSMKAAVPLCGKGKSVPQSDTLFRKKEKKKRRQEEKMIGKEEIRITLFSDQGQGSGHSASTLIEETCGIVDSCNSRSEVDTSR